MFSFTTIFFTVNLTSDVLAFNGVLPSSNLGELLRFLQLSGLSEVWMRASFHALHLPPSHTQLSVPPRSWRSLLWALPPRLLGLWPLRLPEYVICLSHNISNDLSDSLPDHLANMFDTNKTVLGEKPLLNTHIPTLSTTVELMMSENPPLGPVTLWPHKNITKLKFIHRRSCRSHQSHTREAKKQMDSPRAKMPSVALYTVYG